MKANEILGCAVYLSKIAEVLGKDAPGLQELIAHVEQKNKELRAELEQASIEVKKAAAENKMRKRPKK